MVLRKFKAVYFLLGLAGPGHVPPLTLRTNKEQCSYYVLIERTGGTIMLKTFVEEAAALTSLVLFVGMVVVWAQVIQQL